MKGIRTTITAIAATAVALIALTGCTADDESGYYEYPYNGSKPSVMYVDEETGKVTKFVYYTNEWDEESDKAKEVEKVIFEEGYSKKDVEIEYPDRYTRNDPYPSLALSSTIDVDGKPYPFVTNLEWRSTYELDTAAMISYYNENLASAKSIEDGSLEHFPISMMVENSINSSIAKAIDEGALPAIQYQVTGRTVTVADERIISGWNAGTPAWQTLQEVNDSPVNSERYYYSFLCATYDVEITNEEEVRAAANALPNADLVEFWLSQDKESLLIETAQPCTIEPFAGNSVPGDQGGKSYDNAPPAPSQDGVYYHSNDGVTYYESGVVYPGHQ